MGTPYNININNFAWTLHFISALSTGCAITDFATPFHSPYPPTRILILPRSNGTKHYLLRPRHCLLAQRLTGDWLLFEPFSLSHHGHNSPIHYLTSILSTFVAPGLYYSNAFVDITDISTAIIWRRLLKCLR